MIAIGASTGGTEAIAAIMKSLPADAPPILIAQHIPPVFSRAFAERLSRQLGPETPVEMHDERFTTRIAQRTEGPFAASEDSRAAAHLLESWLTARSARG